MSISLAIMLTIFLAPLIGFALFLVFYKPRKKQ